MELKMRLEQLHERVDGLKEQITTEEATKNAFIMPFIQMLGYDIFNPLEVIPEYTCDIGTKKGEKIDYAIFNDGEASILIECKHWKHELNIQNHNQLIRYFHASNAKFAILTNGITYNFYTDLEKPNIMDTTPFLTINLDDLRDNAIKELARFTKNRFDVNLIMLSASSLKYINAIRDEFEKELLTPSDEFIKIFSSRVSSSKMTSGKLETFRDYTKKAISSAINDKVTDILKSAINKNEEQYPKSDEKIESVNGDIQDDGIYTTDEEWEGFLIVKSILREKIAAEKIIPRDTKSYFGVLYEDNNRKPLCRLRFNSETTKYIELFHNGKDGEKIKIETLEDIYNYKKELLQTVDNY